MKYVKGFDSLRAVGCLFVVVGHWGVWFNDKSFSGRFVKHILFPNGSLCVFLFFVLSGFLITSILLTAKSMNGGTGNLPILKSYFVRRSLRIYPVYYLLLFFLFAINFPDVRENIFYFATYTSNLLIYHTGKWNQFCVTWTLSIEEQLYLLWPFVILFVKDKYLKWVFVGAIIIGVVTTYVTMSVQQHNSPCLFYNCLDAFGLGGLYAYVKVRDYHVKQFEKAAKVGALICIPVYFYWQTYLMFDRPAPFFFLWKTVDSVIALWIMILIINSRSAVVRKYFFENKYMNFIGKMSYGIYLLHDVYANGFMGPVNYSLNKMTRFSPSLNRCIMDPHFNYWIHLAIVFSVAAGCYVLIEKPILSLKRFFSYEEETTVAQVN